MSSSAGCSAHDISCPDLSDKALLSAGKNNYTVSMEAVLTKDSLAPVQQAMAHLSHIGASSLRVIAFVSLVAVATKIVD